MEEARALVALEADAQRLLQRRAHRHKLRRVARRFHPRQPVAGIGGEQPCQVPRLGERRPVRQGAGEILAQPRAHLAGEGARLLQPAPEVACTLRQPEGFEPRRAARPVFADQHEVSQVGYQHQPVAVPVAAYLIARRRQPGVVFGRLDLDHAALRRLPFARPALLDLLGGVQPEVGVPRALVGKFLNAEDLGHERRANRVQQVGKRPVAGPLPGRTAGCAHPSKIGEIRLDRLREFRVRSCHRPLCRRARRNLQASARRRLRKASAFAGVRRSVSSSGPLWQLERPGAARRMLRGPRGRCAAMRDASGALPGIAQGMTTT